MLNPELLHILRKLSNPALLVGAELSASSGLPNFYEHPNYRPGLNLAGFELNPAITWGLQDHIETTINKATHSVAHIAIAELSNIFPNLTIYTTDIDSFLLKAGCRATIHALYGQIDSYQCQTNSSLQLQPSGLYIPEPCSINSQFDLKQRLCLKCGGNLRRRLVLDGEPLYGLEEATQVFEQTDGLFVIGINSKVFPANQLVSIAARRRIPILELGENPAIQFTAAFSIRGPISQTLPQLVQALQQV